MTKDDENGRIRTDISPKIHSLEDLDGQIVLHLPHHFHGIIERQVRILHVLRKAKKKKKVSLCIT